MSRFVSLVALAIAGLCLIAAMHARAQSAAPGAGHGFLIDKHVAARVSCAQCHPAGVSQPPATATCLTCHGGNYRALANATAARPNPHESHQGEVACAQCHHVHKASVTLCNQCHTFDMQTP
jgi:fumarate reductase flavoprotein subunit